MFGFVVIASQFDADLRLLWFCVYVIWVLVGFVVLLLLGFLVLLDSGGYLFGVCFVGLSFASFLLLVVCGVFWCLVSGCLLFFLVFTSIGLTFCVLSLRVVVCLLVYICFAA